MAKSLIPGLGRVLATNSLGRLRAIGHTGQL
jgi:hypothetical protein